MNDLNDFSWPPVYIEEYVMSTSARRMLVVALAVSMSALATPGFAARKCTGPKVRTVGAKATANSDIVDTAVAAGSFKTLAAALQAADLVETLKGKGPNGTKIRRNSLSGQGLA